MTTGPFPGHRRGLLHRLTAMICPASERAWIDAMFAELTAIDGGGVRLRWMLGAAAIVGSVIRLRAALFVPGVLWWAIVVALHAVVLFAIGGNSDFEGLQMDDDVFLQFAWVSGALLAGLVVLAINRIFNHTEATPRHRH